GLIGILDKMAKIITQHHTTVHILEFLALLARLPEVFIHLREEEIRPVFGICVRFIQASREKSRKAATRDSSDPSASIDDDLSKYVYSLTYHVMIFWFLSLKLQDRANHVKWITRSLIFTDEHGQDVVEEQSQVLIDMMQRATYSDLGETIPFEKFPPSDADGPVSKKSWIVGMSIVTVEVAGVTGLSQITKRQASGTTYAMYQQRTAPTLPHQIPMTFDAQVAGEESTGPSLAILPSHVLLQLTATAMPTPTMMQPIPLPDDDATNRALRTFDRNDIVDGHKMGVVYVGEGQTTEAEILANTQGSADYEYFLQGLGTKVSLREAKFNTQGLHSDLDGEFTYAWRDRTTEIIYHIATMMPTHLDTDPQCINKKRHLGNDFVNIIFNRSNRPFDFHTIASQFNFVNIIICPVSRIPTSERAHEADPASLGNMDETFYIVKVMTKPGFPELSAAAVPKVISAKNLPVFVRLIALNATFYSSVSSSHGGEHVSSWRNRLREIKRLRSRASSLAAAELDRSGESTYPSTSSFRRNGSARTVDDASVQHQSQHLCLDVTKEWTSHSDTTILGSLDFSSWSR
ncbi:Tuberous sclerosis 2-like protein, partial [Ascosphaera acerosa]